MGLYFLRVVLANNRVQPGQGLLRRRVPGHGAAGEAAYFLAAGFLAAGFFAAGFLAAEIGCMGMEIVR